VAGSGVLQRVASRTPWLGVRGRRRRFRGGLPRRSQPGGLVPRGLTSRDPGGWLVVAADPFDGRYIPADEGQWLPRRHRCPRGRPRPAAAAAAAASAAAASAAAASAAPAASTITVPSIHG